MVLVNEPQSSQMDQVPSTSEPCTVYVVERDVAVGDGLRALLAQLDAEVKVYQRAGEMLSAHRGPGPACLVTALFPPDMSGLELLQRLRKLGSDIPVIVLASHGDVPTAVEAMRLGAIDFIEKPFVEDVLLQRVREALRPGQQAHA